MYRIQTRNAISPEGLSLFSKSLYEVNADVSSPDALLLRSHKLLPEDIPASVKAIARAGAGVNNIPVDHCTERGIVVFNTPGANANSVKELVIAGLLLSSRRIHEGMNWVSRQDAGNDLAAKVEKEKSAFAGVEIQGKSLGVVGLGAIGVQVANAATDLGMVVHGCDPFISIAAAWGLSSRVRRCENLSQIMARCDYLTLHVPLTEKTRGFINAEVLVKARKGMRVLNFSRGGLVDEDGVKQALDAGGVFRYVTDFPSPNLLKTPGVLSIPHLGASTAEAENNCAMMAGRQLQDFLENGNVANSVNFPACELEPAGGVRLTLANNNVPNMLSQILTVLADEELNVENMINRHRGDVAYNIIDVSTNRIRREVMLRLGNIEGVIGARQIPR